jgi:hypothetical protein
MSMIGKFVQVEPDRFKQVLSDPSSVTELFMEKAPAMAKLFALSETMRERARNIAPGALGPWIDGLPPQARERLAERFKQLGVDLESVKSGSGEAIGNLLQALHQQLGAMSRPLAGGSRPAPIPSLSLEKDWHAVHYLLCGAAEPGKSLLSQVVLGGTEVGDDDLGYGPARYFDANKTADIARELGRGGLEDEMRARFDPAKMVAAGLYPGGWEPDEIDNLIGEFHQLRDFFADASAHGRIVVTCLT